MKKFVKNIKELNRLFLKVILVPIYFLAIGFTYGLKQTIQKKLEKHDSSYWIPSSQFEETDFFSSY